PPSWAYRIAATSGATSPSTSTTEMTVCTAVRHEARTGWACWVDVVVVTGSVLLGEGIDVDDVVGCGLRGGVGDGDLDLDDAGLEDVAHALLDRVEVDVASGGELGHGLAE